MSTVRIAAAQTPEFREDVESAVTHLAGAMEHAADQGASLLCLPEGFLQGYLTDEAAARRAALELDSPAFGALLDRLPNSGPATVFGMIEKDGDRIFNTAVVVRGRALIGRYRKTNLLGSERCFDAGDAPGVFEVDGLRFGINICSDTRIPALAKAVADQGATLLVCPANNMLPREIAEKWRDAHSTIRGERCRETGLWAISADVTGERDDRVSWGPTAVLAPSGEVAKQLPLDEPGLLIFDLGAGPSDQ